MKDVMTDFEPALAGLGLDDWFDRIEEFTSEEGRFDDIGADHAAAFIDAGSSLLVTFESYPEICQYGPEREPRAFSMVRRNGWSCLTILSEGPSWFRDPALYEYFDRLQDDGFFDRFDNILFFGTHAGGYAAAAYSVAAPGARVLALRPVASLDPRVTGWDERYRSFRRISFTDRYGFAPDMIEAAAEAWIVFDPSLSEDATHAALFRRPNVQFLPTRYLGRQVDAALGAFGILPRLIEAAMRGGLDTLEFARLFRNRRKSQFYLRTLLRALEESGHPDLAIRLCEYVLARKDVPAFAQRLERLRARRFEHS